MSGKHTDGESRTSTRRTALRVIGGTGAACLTIPGVTAAASDSADEKNKSDPGRSVSEEELEVSAEEMATLREEVRSNANVQTGSNVHISRTKEFEGSFEVAGLEVGVFGTLGPCEAEIGITVLNQTETATLTCSDYTREWNIDLVAAELDAEVVVDFDNESVSVDAEGCYYQFTGWECGSNSATFYFR